MSNRRLTADYWRMVLDVDGPAAGAAAGQFFQILCPASGSDHPYLRRPMSVYRADPVRGRVEFLYKVTGAGTRGLSSLTPGADLPIFGPLGTGFRIDASWKAVVVVGRGVGLATLAPLADSACARGVHVVAIVSARSPAHAITVDRFAAAGAQVITVVDSDGSSDPPRVAGLVRALVAAGRADALFTCGSNRLIRLLQGIAAEHGIPGQVALEQQMACGLGMCFSCVRAFRIGDRVVSKRVCWEGPVFDLQEPTGW